MRAEQSIRYQRGCRTQTHLLSALRKQTLGSIIEHDEGSLLHIGEAIWSYSRETGGKFTMSVVYIVHMVDRLG